MSQRMKVKYTITMPYKARFCDIPINNRYFQQDGGRNEGPNFEDRHVISLSTPGDDAEGVGEYCDFIVKGVSGLRAGADHNWFTERAINQAGSTPTADQYQDREFRIHLRLQSKDHVYLNNALELLDVIFSPENSRVAFPPQYGSIGALIELFGSYPPCLERNPWTFTKRRGDGTYRHADFFPVGFEFGNEENQENNYAQEVSIICAMFDPFTYGSEERLYFNGNSILRDDWDGSQPPTSTILDMPCYTGSRPLPYTVRIATMNPTSTNQVYGLGFYIEELGVNRLLAHANLGVPAAPGWEIFSIIDQIQEITLDTRNFTQNLSITNITGGIVTQLDGNLDPNGATVTEMLLVPQHTHKWFMITSDPLEVGGSGTPVAFISFNRRYGGF